MHKFCKPLKHKLNINLIFSCQTVKTRKWNLNRRKRRRKKLLRAKRRRKKKLLLQPHLSRRSLKRRFINYFLAVVDVSLFCYTGQPGHQSALSSKPTGYCHFRLRFELWDSNFVNDFCIVCIAMLYFSFFQFPLTIPTYLLTLEPPTYLLTLKPPTCLLTLKLPTYLLTLKPPTYLLTLKPPTCLLTLKLPTYLLTLKPPTYLLTLKPPTYHSQFQFVFNICDRGFTELHNIWREEHFSGNTSIWSRLHDYW